MGIVSCKSCSIHTGVPVSGLPNEVAVLLRRGMDDVKLVLAEGTRAQVNTAAVCAVTLRDVFFDCFTTFASAIDKARYTPLP